MLVHANAEKQPLEESALGALFGVVPGSETGAQLQLFSIGEPRTPLWDLQPSDQKFPDDLLGMYFFG